MKKYLLGSLVYIFFLFVLSQNSQIKAQNLIINQNYHAIENNENLAIYKDNVLIDILNESTILDLNNEYLLYNTNNIINLYILETGVSQKITSLGYNAMFYNESVIYESDVNDNYKCKNIVGNVTYRNCYKLYIYNIASRVTSLIELNGNDVYLNDIEENNLVYTSIHNKDNICTSLCSFINLYNLSTKENMIINEYNDLVLDMSGNASIDKGIIYFESVPEIYGCNVSQIFYFDTTNYSIDMITKSENNCFSTNSEIVDANNGYLIFKSKYGNYQSNEFMNYIYSYDDIKYKIMENKCKYNSSSIINNNQINCLDNEVILSYLLDDKAPVINLEEIYTTLKEKEDVLLANLKYSDDLSSKENIKVIILNDLSIVGEQIINIKLCDKFNNCSINEVLVNIIDKDITPPKIYFSDSITIKNNEELILDKYGYAIDNVDGKVGVELVSDINISKKGTYNILIKSEDNSGNISYKEIELIIYDNFAFISLYYLSIIATFIVIIIIYIFRVKKYKGI